MLFMYLKHENHVILIYHGKASHKVTIYILSFLKIQKDKNATHVIATHSS